MAQGGVTPDVSALFDGGAKLDHVSFTPALEQGKIDNVRFEDADGLRRFYESNHYDPIWVSTRGRKTRRSEAVFESLSRAWTHGLNPYNYHLREIAALLDAEDEDDLYALELLTSDAVVRYVRDLSAMRVDDRRLVSSTIRDMQRYPISEDVLTFLKDDNSPGRALSSFEPQGHLYSILQAELIELVNGKVEPYEEHLPIKFSGLLRPGDSHAAIPVIRQRLGVTENEGSKTYDDYLGQAVMTYQRANGLGDDGVIGPQTLELLNITRQDKIDRVVANLERLRWVAQKKPERYILVNIPSATLWGIERGHTALEMPVIMGTRGRATRSFVTEIQGIRFNPNWTIPPTIKKEDFLPNLVEDPYYATNRGVEMVVGYGDDQITIDPGSVDWANITWDEFKQIRMVQDPGATNPLGQMRVLMPNPYNIYLHDTNKPEYFEKENRFLSSGCVRVSRPMELAHFIMQGRDDWSDQKLLSILGSGRLTEVKTPAPLPVYIVYQTVWLGDDSRVVYGPDVYGWDRKLSGYMKNNDLFFTPERNAELDKIVLNSVHQGLAGATVTP